MFMEGSPQMLQVKTGAVTIPELAIMDEKLSWSWVPAAAAGRRGNAGLRGRPLGIPVLFGSRDLADIGANDRDYCYFPPAGIASGWRAPGSDICGRLRPTNPCWIPATACGNK